MIRAIALFVFVFLTIPSAFAGDGVCTTTPGKIGGYPFFDILTDQDLKEAIVCAVNRSSVTVIGENSFRNIYNVTMDEEQAKHIRLRRQEGDPLSNRINRYDISFLATYDGRIETKIYCSLKVDFRKIEERKAVVVNLDNCQASAFGVYTYYSKANKLSAWAVFTYL